MRKRSQGTKQTVGSVPASEPPLHDEQSAPEYYIRQEAIPLPFGTKGEQQEIETWKALVCDPDFRADVKNVQQQLGPTYWQTLSHSQTLCQGLKNLLSEACTRVLNDFQRKNQRIPITVGPPSVSLKHEAEIERLLKKWALNDLKDADWWLEHLLRFWDTTSNNLPRLEAPMRYVPLDLPSGSTYVHYRTPLFKTLMATVEYFSTSLNDPTKIKPRRALITLRPGVSLRQARQAADVAVKRLGSKAVRHRPALTDLDRSCLRMLFNFHRPSINKESAIWVIRAVYHQLREWERPITTAKIRDEYRLWRKENGYPVRNNLTARLDRRS
jgi:hypothetical protein